MKDQSAKRSSRQAKSWPKVTAKAHKSGIRTWLVDARIAGSGERLYFPSKAEADTKAGQLRIERLNKGIAGIAFPDRIRHEALDAEEKLAAVGATIPDAVAYFLAHARPVSGEKIVAEVVVEFLKIKTQSGLRDSYLSVQKYVLGNVFGGEFGGRKTGRRASANCNPSAMSPARSEAGACR